MAKCYRLLRAILNTAVKDGHLSANPCSIKGAGVEPCDERRIATVDEVYALANAVLPRLCAFVLLAAVGGLRRGERFGLTRRDIHLLHRTRKVRAQRQESNSGATIVGPPKSAAGRRSLSLPAEIAPAIEDHLAQWVTADPDARVRRRARRAATTWCVAARVGTRPHPGWPTRPPPPRSSHAAGCAVLPACDRRP